ncbi:MAG: NAD-dependent epimerase/dehydratase family protein [Acidobacteria bacterium]|nr:NAD-dependent epimerase/dehydratase family protein [Acidobacteriota bacterium]
MASLAPGSRALVTGGAGFIGSNLTRALLARGVEVVVLDDLCNGLRENLPEDPRCSFVEGDIRDAGVVREAAEGCEVVFHQAAIGSVPRSMREPLIYYDVNLRGSAVVFEAARDAGVRRVVWASSSSVYGNTEAAEKREGEEGKPISPYAASKAGIEVVAAAHSEAYDQEIVGLRYFNVYGPFQRSDSAYAAVVPLFVAALESGERPRIFGDGEQARDFSFVADVVDANLLAATVDASMRGEVFNVSGDRAYSVNQLLAAVAAALGCAEPGPEYLSPRKGDIRRSKADLARARRILGYSPGTSLADGLAQTVAWFRSRARG